MKYDKIKILDLEKTRDNGRFRVRFEVPGKHFNQNYPKRLSHTFPKKEHFFEEVEEGFMRYEKIIRDLYLADDSDKEEKKKADKKFENVQQKAKDRTFEN